MVAGLALGKGAPSIVDALRGMEFGKGSQVNIPIAVLIWLMIIPMMMKVDFGAIREVGKRPRGLLVTLFVNWLVKPFSMALIAWVFFRCLSALDHSGGCRPVHRRMHHPGGSSVHGDGVYVSYLTDGDPAYTLVQVSVNDLIMLFLFAPIVRFLVSGASSLIVPFQSAALGRRYLHRGSVLTGILVRAWMTRKHGNAWFESDCFRGSRP